MWYIFCRITVYRSLKLQGIKSWLVTWTFLHRKYHYHQRTYAWFLISPNNYDIMDLFFIWDLIYHGSYSYSQSVAWHIFSHRSCPTDASRNTLCDRKESVGCAIHFLKSQTKRQLPVVSFHAPGRDLDSEQLPTPFLGGIHSSTLNIWS